MTWITSGPCGVNRSWRWYVTPGVSSTRPAVADGANTVASSTAMRTLRSTTLPEASERPRGTALTLDLANGNQPLVPDANVPVQRVALHRGLAERLDGADEVVRRGAMRRPGRRDDVLLDHHGAEVVGSEAE